MKKLIFILVSLFVVALCVGCKKSPSITENKEPSQNPELSQEAQDAEEKELQGAVIELEQKFESKILNNSRKIIIYLPPSYDNSSKRYPVIYAHDGQNLFNKNYGGSSTRWDIDKTLNKLISQDLIEEVIVVGIYNTSARMDEYTPIYNKYYKAGGEGDKYLHFIMDELKLYIDKNYRTLADASNTAIMGSSLGGLISFYAGYRYPDVFGKVIAVSPSFFWHDAEDMDPIFRNNNRYMINEVAGKSEPKQIAKTWIDIGTNEEQDDRDKDGLNDAMDDARDMVKTLLQKDYTYLKDFLYYEHAGAIHSEIDWKDRVFMPLIYMFGKKPLIERAFEIQCADKVLNSKNFYPSPTIIYENGVAGTPIWLSLESTDKDILEINEHGGFTAKGTGMVSINASYKGFETSKTVEVFDVK